MINDRIEELEKEFMDLNRKWYHEVLDQYALGYKDRDCHWRIVKSWDYGETPLYYIEHNGYLYEDISCNKLYDDYKSVLEAAIEHIKNAILEWSNYDKR